LGKNNFSNFQHLHTDLPSLILDVLGILDAETSVNIDTVDERAAFCYISKESEKFLSEKLLKERLEMDTLQEIGTVKNKSFYTKFIKVKTKL
jgi:THO complex subunit 2